MTLMRGRKPLGMTVPPVNRTAARVYRTADRVCKAVCRRALRPVQWLRSYYSRALERELTLHQTLLLVNAQLAFFFALLPAEAPLTARAVCGLWLWKALCACRRALAGR